MVEKLRVHIQPAMGFIRTVTVCTLGLGVFVSIISFGIGVLSVQKGTDKVRDLRLRIKKYNDKRLRKKYFFFDEEDMY